MVIYNNKRNTTKRLILLPLESMGNLPLVLMVAGERPKFLSKNLYKRGCGENVASLGLSFTASALVWVFLRESVRNQSYFSKYFRCSFPNLELV